MGRIRVLSVQNIRSGVNGGGIMCRHQPPRDTHTRNRIVAIVIQDHELSREVERDIKPLGIGRSRELEAH